MDVARPLAAACKDRGMTLDVYVKVDTGLGRTGRSPEGAVELARDLKQLEPLHLVGIMSHCGFSYGRQGPEELAEVAREDGQLMVQTKESLEKIGISIREVSVVNAYLLTASCPKCYGNPGAPMFNDGNNVLLGIVEETRCIGLDHGHSRPNPVTGRITQ